MCKLLIRMFSPFSSHAETPAAAAGLKRYDVILEVDGVAIRNGTHLTTFISTRPPAFCAASP